VARTPPEPRPEISVAPFGKFDEFFDANYRPLVKIAMFAGASLHDAEEVVHETMTYLYKRWGEITEPRAYARKAVVTNVIKLKKRDGQRFDRTVSGGHVTPDVDDCTAMTVWEERQWVTQRLAALPPAQREVMAGFFDDLSTSEIAEALGKTEATVRKNLQWARERLKSDILGERHQQNPNRDAPTRMREETR